MTIGEIMEEKKAIIIGAGPAGLTAAYELLKKTNIKPVIFEETFDIGGISKTVNYKGNRIDIGGHRFFSKSDRVMKWWMNMMPIEENSKKNDNGFKADEVPKKTIKNNQRVMLIRNRLSRIYYIRKFFNYPISLTFETIHNLGVSRTIKIGLSYIISRLFPIKNEVSLEDFLINRFGKELYETFFKDYTQKVWGVPCNEIPSEWGAQRIKGLSISKAILHALKKNLSKDGSILQKKTETSLIEKFLYPKYGPGQMWEEVAKRIKDQGGEILFGQKAIRLNIQNSSIKQIVIKDQNAGIEKKYTPSYVFSTMPVRDLILGIDKKSELSEDVKKVAEGLEYRDFITVGLLLNELKIKNKKENSQNNDGLIPDNWIYIQEKDVRLGRLQIFNNWSPYLVKDKSKIWIGLEYFCTEGDELWEKNDEAFAKFAIKELTKIDIIEEKSVLDYIVIRVPKTYPAYFGTYKHFDKIINYVNNVQNLFLIGRNGMHRYNNQDHSMLTAMRAVDNIVEKIISKNNIWEINTEEDYHEEKR